ncbi:hypothetical protein BDEG_21447 [Batrachochytrium dendrobatidis JEL423]|uniref:Pericentrin/AKAP-450 centrosomal targeting domain-containing protein n=1 Tax=Batrachochytrium dendrobatidis (strain JEL423) TaxID=403673 RepID=A0A177WBG9_BATDL|nr:hypothetical protein BDEG_21447 [Batrachochytrium dendrobatidis JEL423]
MESREQQLERTKQKLQRFRNSRAPGAYSVHSAISSSSTVHGQPLSGLGLVSKSSNGSLKRTDAHSVTSDIEVQPASSIASSSEMSDTRRQIMNLPSTVSLKSLSRQTSRSQLRTDLDHDFTSNYSECESKISATSMVGIDLETDPNLAEIDRLVLYDGANDSISLSITSNARSSSIRADSPSTQSVMKSKQDILVRSASVSGRRDSIQSSIHESQRLHSQEEQLQKIHGQYISRIEKLEAELDEYRSKYDTELNTLGRHNHNLKAALQTAEIRSAELDMQFERDYGEVEENRMRTRLLEEDNAMLNQQREMLEMQLENALSVNKPISSLVPDNNLSEVELLQNQLLEYQSMTETLKQGAHEAHLQITELISAKHVLEETVESLKGDFDLMPHVDSDSLDTCSKEVVQLQDIITKHKEHVTLLKDQIADLETCLLNKTNSHRELELEIERLTSLLAESTEALKQVEARLVEVESNSLLTIDGFMQQISSLQTELAAIKTLVHPSASTNVESGIIGEFFNCLDETTGAKDEISQLQAQLHDALLGQKDFSDRLEAANEQRALLQIQLDGMNLDLSHSGADFSSQTQQLHEKIEELSAENSRLQSEIDALYSKTTTESTNAIADSSDVEQYRMLTEHMSQLVETTATSEQEHLLKIENLQNTIEWVQEEKQTLTADFEQQIQVLQCELSTISAERDALIANAKHTNTSYGNTAIDKDESFARAMELELEVETLKTDLQSVRDENDTLKRLSQKHNTATTSSKTIQLSPMTKLAEVTQPDILSAQDTDGWDEFPLLSPEVDDLKVIIDDLKTQLQTITIERDHLASCTITTGSASSSGAYDMSSLQNELIAITTESDNLKSKANAARLELETFRKQSIDDQEQLVDTMRNLTERNSEYQILLAELQAKNDALLKRTSTLDTLDASVLTDFSPDFEQLSEALKKITELEAKIASMEADYSDTLVQCDDKIQQLQDQLCAAQSKVVESATELANSSDLINEKKTSDAQLADIEVRLADQTVFAEKLTQKIVEMQDELNYLQDEKHYFEERCDELQSIIESNNVKFENELAKLEAAHSNTSNQLDEVGIERKSENESTALHIETINMQLSSLKQERDQLAALLEQAQKDALASRSELDDAIHASQSSSALSEEVERLKEYILVLEDKIATLENELDIMRTSSQQWEDYAATSLEETNELHAQELACRDENESALTHKIEHLSAQLLQAQQSFSNTEDLVSANEDLTSKNNTLETTLEDLRHATELEVLSLTDKLRDVNFKFIEAQDQSSKMESQLKETSSRYDELAHTHDQIKFEKEAFERDVLSLKENIKQLEASISNNESRTSHISQEAEALKHNYENIVAIRDDLQLQLEAADLRSQNLEQQNMEHRSHIESICTSQEGLIAERDTLTQQIQQLSQSLDAAKLDIVRLNDFCANVESDKSAFGDVQQRLDEHVLLVQQLQADKETLVNTLDEMRASQDQLHVDLDALKTQKNELDITCAENDQYVSELTLQIQDAQQAVNEWQAYAQTFETEKSEWESRRIEFEDRLANISNERSSEMDIIIQELDQVKNEKEQLMAVHNEQSHELATLAHEHSNLSKRMAEIELERSEMEYEIQNMHKSTDASKATQIELEKLQEESRQLRFSMEQSEQHYQQQLEKNAFDFDSLQERIMQLTQEQAELQQEKNALQEELNVLLESQTKSREMEEHYHELKLTNAQIQQEYQQVLLQLQTTDSQLTRFSELEQQLATKTEEIDHSSKEISQLSQELELCKLDHLNAVKSLAERDHELFAVQEKYVQMEHSLEQAQSHKKAEVSDLQYQLSQLSAKVPELESHVTYYLEKIALMEDAAHASNEKLQLAQEQYAALEKELYDCKHELHDNHEAHCVEMDALKASHEDHKISLNANYDEIYSQLTYQANEVQRLTMLLEEAQHNVAMAQEQHRDVESELLSIKHVHSEAIGQLNTNLSDQVAEFSTLTAKAQQLEAENTLLKQSVEKYVQEITQLQDSVTKVQDAYDLVKKNLGETELRLSELKAANLLSIDKSTNADIQTKQLQQNIDDLTKKLADAKQSKSEVVVKLEEMNDILLRKDGQLETAQAATAAVNAQLASLLQQHKIDLEMHRSNCVQSDTSEQLRYKALEAELADTKNVLAITQNKLLLARPFTNPEQALADGITNLSMTGMHDRGNFSSAELQSLRAEMAQLTSEKQALISALDARSEHHGTKHTSAAVEVIRLQTVVAELQGKLAESDHLLSALQPALDELDSKNREVEKLSHLVRSLGVKMDANGTALVLMQDESPKIPAGMRQVSIADHALLEAKACNVDQSMNQLESALALIEENDGEIKTLRNTIEELLNNSFAGMSETPDGPDLKLLQRQIDELRKLWSHELSANSILRNLIAKAQADAHQYQQESQCKIASMKEEFDELAHVCEIAQRDIDVVQHEAKTHELNARSIEKQFEDRLNTQYFEHHNQIAVQDELHTKERAALNKLVGSLEAERDRLVSELARLKSRQQSHSTDSVRDSDFFKQRLAEKEAMLLEAESNLRQVEIKVRDAEFHIRDCEANIKKMDQVHKDVVADLDSRLQHLNLHSQLLETKLKDSEFALAKALADAARASQEAAYFSDRYRSMEDTYKQVPGTHHLQRTQEDHESHRHAWLSERAQLETELRKKHMEILDRDQILMEERQRMRAIADEEIRSAVAAEQRHSRDLLNARIGELRSKYDTALDELRAQKRKVEEQLDDTEHMLFEERDSLQRRLFDTEERERVQSAEVIILQERLTRRDKLQSDRQTTESLTERAEKWHCKSLELEMRITQLEQEFDTERRDLEKRLNDAVVQSRLADQRLTDRDVLWTNERRGFEQEIDRVRQDAAKLASQLRAEDTNGLLKSLQEQKNEIETLLRDREARLIDLETRLQDQIARNTETTENWHRVVAQSQVMESRLIERDAQLREAQTKVHSLTLQLSQFENKDIVSPIVSEQHHSQMEEAKRQADAQIKFERERAKRLALKIEDLKNRNQQLKRQVETHSQPMQLNSQAAAEEIESMRHELSNLRISNGEVLAILREMLINTIGPGAIDIPDLEVNKIRLNLPKLREQCRSLVQELVYVRALVNRLVLWRGDLRYQKLYLSFKVDDLLESQKMSLSYLHGMGVIMDKPDFTKSLTPRRKLIRCINAVIAVHRIKIMAARWQTFLEGNGSFSLDEYHGAEIGYNQTGLVAVSTKNQFSRQWSYGELSSDAQNQHVKDLERNLQQARMGQAAIEERLNEELYEKRAIEMENERLLRALKYDRHNLSHISSPMHFIQDRMSPAPPSAAGSVTNSLYREEQGRHSQHIPHGMMDDRQFTSQLNGSTYPTDQRWSQQPTRFR